MKTRSRGTDVCAKICRWYSLNFFFFFLKFHSKCFWSRWIITKSRGSLEFNLSFIEGEVSTRNRDFNLQRVFSLSPWVKIFTLHSFCEWDFALWLHLTSSLFEENFIENIYSSRYTYGRFSMKLFSKGTSRNATQEAKRKERKSTTSWMLSILSLDSYIFSCYISCLINSAKISKASMFPGKSISIIKTVRSTALNRLIYGTSLPFVWSRQEKKTWPRSGIRASQDVAIPQITSCVDVNAGRLDKDRMLFIQRICIIIPSLRARARALAIVVAFSEIVNMKRKQCAPLK